MKSKVTSVWELDVFKLAHKLAVQIYKTTSAFPKSELYALTSQMRRAATSVPMNLAEGSSRGSKAEYRRYVSIARGSVGEISYQIYLCRDLEYINDSTCNTLREEYDRVGRMLTKLVQSLGTIIK